MDDILPPLGLRVLGGDHTRRIYAGQLAGRPVRAELTVLMVGRDVHNKLSVDVARLDAGGYRLTVEVTTELPARLAAGRSMPLLVGRGLPEVATPFAGHPELSLYAHDPAWARRLVDDPAANAAMCTLLHSVEFIEHRPDQLQIQLHRAPREGQGVIAPQQDEIPQLIAALDTVVRCLVAAPSPVPAQPRWSDDRGRLVVVISVAVLLCVALTIAAIVWVT